MKDLFLTPRGDLSIENIIDSKERLEINFITSKSNALRLNFFVEDTFSKNLPANSLAINFNSNKASLRGFNKPDFMISRSKAATISITSWYFLSLLTLVTEFKFCWL